MYQVLVLGNVWKQLVECLVVLYETLQGESGEGKKRESGPCLFFFKPMLCSIVEAERRRSAEAQTMVGTHAVRHGALGLLGASAVPVERLRPAEAKSGSGEHADPR